MKKVLLTGGTGFVGSHLVRQLNQNGISVRCLVRQNSSRELLGACEAEYVLGDLNDRESLCQIVKGCDTVFHVAGLVRARCYKEFEAVNRFGTENLAYAAAAQSSPPVFVYVSSLSAAGHSTVDQPKQESSPSLPLSGYGKSKLAGENALMPFAERLPCTIVRPGIVFGEADKMNLEIFRFIKRWKACPIPGYKDKFYSWIHAADLSQLLIAAAQRGERLAANQPIGTGMYYAASDTGRKMIEIGRMIAHSLGLEKVYTLPCTPIPLWIISTYGEAKKWCTGKMPPLDWEKARELLHHWTCSSEKAQKQLGFSSKPLKDRINQTTQWFLKKGWL